MKHPDAYPPGIEAGRGARGGAVDGCLRQQERRRTDAMANAATPGSQQDFVVNVGDRVFFESDQTDLTPQAIATLEKQAQWLQSYQPLRLHHRRPCRRARHPRIQHRARRPPRPVGARLPRLARHRPEPHAHDLLRQGASGRGLQRHLLLVAEPPRRHRAERQLLSGQAPFIFRNRSCRRPFGRRFLLVERSVDRNPVWIPQSHFWRTPASMCGRAFVSADFAFVVRAKCHPDFLRLTRRRGDRRDARFALAGFRAIRRCRSRRCGSSGWRTSCAN